MNRITTSELEKIKTAKFCVFDGGSGIFVFENGEQLEISERDILIAFCELFNIEIEGC